MTTNNNPEADAPCTLTRQCAVIAYDTIAVLALWFAATALLLPFTGAEAIEPGQRWYPLYPPYLLLVNWLYLMMSWRRSGQTLGMKAWRVHLITDSGKKISWRSSAVRFGTACVGFLLLCLGFLSSLWREDRRTWQDRASQSRLIHRRKKDQVNVRDAVQGR